MLPIFEYVAPAATRHTSSAVVNCGQAGSPLSRYVECTSTMVPANADLILIDAATIDDNPRAMEVVLRRLAHQLEVGCSTPAVCSSRSDSNASLPIFNTCHPRPALAVARISSTVWCRSAA